MSPGRIAVGRARAVRAILALTAVSGCLGAAAYAATRAPQTGLSGSKPVAVTPQHGADTSPGPGPGEKSEPLPRASFIEYPEAVSVATEPQFRFHVASRAQTSPAAPAGPPAEPERPRRFQCRLDGGVWATCSSPYRLRGPGLGGHTLAVRALNRAAQPGPAVGYSWRQSEPPAEPVQVKAQEEVPVSGDSKPFSIELSGSLEELHPGFPPQPLVLLITNPSSEPIEVTGLTAAIAADSPECSAENFALTQSGASPATPLAVPAGGSASLPTATVSAPTIAMLNLPVDQDACQGAEIPLVFEGEARG